MDNPFKFGTLVDEPYFTDRIEEPARIGQLDWLKEARTD